MEDLIFRNTFRDIKHILKVLGEGLRHALRVRVLRPGPSLQPRAFRRRRLIKGPLFIQCIFGILGGMGPDPENLVVMRTTADRLFGRSNYRFSVLGAGRHQMPLLTMGAVMGGNVRVGLEDSLYLGQGPARQVLRRAGAKDPRILDELSLESPRPMRRARCWG
jgi:uncharacterized protein (DUF849 family)